MTTYTNVFGGDTLPPAEYGYKAYTFLVSATLTWPDNAGPGDLAIAKIMDVSCAPGVIVTLPAANLVSTGEDFLFRNIGAEPLEIRDAADTTVATVQSGQASYFYLTNNTTEAGAYGVVAFGAGTSFVDAASLIGYGIKAIGGSLNQAHQVVSIASTETLDAAYRAKMVVSTGGALTINLASATVLGNDFFVYLRNAGTGTVTIDPNGTETIDAQASMSMQPGESLILFCSGAQWYSVGYGRSTVYQFTQLVKDVSAGGTFTLTNTEAGNKLMTFIGNPATAVTVEVPPVVAVYYLSSALSTTQAVTFKTALGSGISLPQGARVIALCDGTNVTSAQTVQASSAVSIIDGSEASPSLNFASATSTGLYKHGTAGIGISAGGAAAAVFDSGTAQIINPQPYTQYALVSAPTYQEGRVFYDTTEKTLAYYNDTSAVTVNVGQEQIVRARNNTGSTILDGQVVYISGALSDRPTVALAQANTLATSNRKLGVATANILNGADGYITTQGVVRGLNTNAWAPGTVLYLSAATPGALVSAAPTAPSFTVCVAVVTRQHATQGTLYVGQDVAQPLNVGLNAIAALTPAADRLPYFNAANTAALAVLSAYGRSLIDDADATAARTTLGLGPLATLDSAALNALGTLTPASDRLPYFDSSTTSALATFTAFGRSLIDDADAAAARTTLGLGTAATQTVTTSRSDSNEGRVLKVGDYGIGRVFNTVNNFDYNAFGDNFTSGFNESLQDLTPSNGPPTGVNYYVQQLKYQSNPLQIAWPYRAGVEDVWLRSRSSGTWSSWYKMLTTKNTLDIGTTEASARAALSLGTLATLNSVALTNMDATARADGKQTIWVPAGAMRPRSTNGAQSSTVQLPTNGTMVSALAYDTATEEYAQFQIRMPKSWNEGTITCTAVWTADSTSTASVVWAVRAKALANDTTIDSAWGTAVAILDANTATAYQVHISPESVGMTVSGASELGWVVVEVFRQVANASDTLATDALLLGVTINYTTDAANDA